MDVSIEWLKAQLERANHDLERAQQQLTKAQVLVQETQQRVSAYAAVIKEAEVECGITKDHSEEGTMTINMPDHIENVLREHGPLYLSQIYEILRSEGRKKTTPNSVNTQLNKHKPSRFIKDENGKWDLATQNLTLGFSQPPISDSHAANE